MRLVDTHCHLQDESFDGDREEVIARALDSLAWITVVGDDTVFNDVAIGLIRPRVHAVVGYHPYSAKDLTDEKMARLRESAGRPGVVAIGEIGLDYHNEFSPRADQHVAFRRQLDLAVALGMPVAVHSRDADEDIGAILEEYAGRLPAGVIHCFGSGASFAERCVAMGWYISFAGNATFPKAQNLRDAAKVVPMDRILVETDAPYLAPQPKRGKRNEPVYVEHTARALADVKGVPFDEFAARTTENACRLYGV